MTFAHQPRDVVGDRLCRDPVTRQGGRSLALLAVGGQRSEWFWHSCNDTTTMCQRQPLGKLARRLIGRGSIKGHHCSWHARQSPELRAPTVADRRYLDVVRTAANGLFEAMNDHLVLSERKRSSSNQTASILRGRDIQSSEAARESAVHTVVTLSTTHDPVEEIFAVSVSPQDLHRWHTVFPHPPSLHELSAEILEVECCVTAPWL